MHQVQRKRDAAEVLAEARLEEAFQHGDALDRSNQEHARPEQIKPLVVVDGLRLEEREVVPSGRLGQVVDVLGVHRYAAQVKADDKQRVEDVFAEGLELRQPAGEFVFHGQQVEVVEEHAGAEQGVVGSVDDVDKVEDERELAPQSCLSRAPRKGEQAGVDDHGPLELHGDGPQVEVVAQPGLAAQMVDEAEVFDFGVPPPELVAVVALRLRAVDPDAKRMPRGHEQEGGRDQRHEQPQPSPE